MKKYIYISPKIIFHCQQQVWRVIIRACNYQAEVMHLWAICFFSAHPCWTTALPLCLLFPRWSLTPRLLLTELPAEQTDKIGPGPAVGGTESGTQQLGEGPQKAAAGKKRKRKKTKEKDSVERFVRFSHLTDRFHRTAEFKDEFSRPDVAFCHRDRRKVTSAEICRAR